MALRDINTNLLQALEDNVPFTYAHLVKFERPLLESQYGNEATAAKNYSYITDAPFDVKFNDSSTSPTGAANGLQNYISNKLLKIGGTNETIKAKASTMVLDLDATSLGAKAVSPTINTNGSIAADATGSITSTDTNFVELGFKEGDKVSILHSGNTYNVRINTFINDGKGFNCLALDLVASINATVTSITLESEELTALTRSKDSTSYTSYLNREVYIYKVFIAPEKIVLTNGTSYEAGDIIGGIGTNSGLNTGGGVLIFKGIISNANIKESTKDSIISWTISSHWADFQRVQGRRTEDSSHRAVDSDGLPDREATIRPQYANDLGFIHSQTAVNVTAIYNKVETKTEVDYDSGLFGSGIGADVDSREVEYDVPTELDLKFNLEAKYLPVIYGVQRVSSIPIFADTRAGKSTEIHMVYALSEGTVGGLYDIHLDGNSSICVDQTDYDVRGTVVASEDDGKIDFVCRGRQTFGHTLLGYDATAGATPVFASDSVGGASSTTTTTNTSTLPATDSFTVPSFSSLNANVGNNGMTHGTSHSFEDPINCHMTFHQGRPYQKANDRLVSIAQSASASGRFKVQNDYYEKKEAYWGPNHRLLDTSYIHAQYEIDDGETTLPKFNVVMRGRDVEAFNYDYSYAQDVRYRNNTVSSSAFSAGPDSFEIGDIVSLRKGDDDSLIGNLNDWIVHDKWFFYSGEDDTRVVNNNPELRIPHYRFIIKHKDTGAYPTINELSYITDGSNSWYINTYDSKLHTSDNTVATALVANPDTTGYGAQKITLLSPSSPMEAALALPGVSVSLESSKNASFHQATFAGFNYASDELTNLGSNVTWTNAITKVLVNNGIVISGSSGVNDKYNGARITLTRINTDGTTYVQTRRIVDYHGQHKVIIVDTPWDAGYLPNYPSGVVDKYNIELAVDERPSINPALQMLDYLRNKRFGKGLKLPEIDLNSFKESALECDGKSDVSVVCTTAAASNIAVGTIYHRGTAGTTGYWRGEVSAVGAEKTIDSVGYKQITFTNCIGKLGKKWNKFTYYISGEPLWRAGVAKLANANGFIDSFPGTSAINTLPLTKDSTNVAAPGNGPTTLDIDTSVFTAGNRNPYVKGFNENFNTFSGSGYSLYDSDDLEYWKYAGWDDNTQRYVTRHQMNQSINTAQPLFGNVNKMLSQFNGMLRYTGGKYNLSVKSKKGTVNSLEQFEAGDIIGEIKITDQGSKKSYNSAQLAFPDPQNRFENREISFFDSKLLKQDKGIRKNLSYQSRGITNYFNARFNVVQKLKESRQGLTVNFKVGPRGLALLPGEIIELTHPKFGFTSKPFRVTSLNYTKDCLCSVTADEHSDSAYVIGDGDRIQENLDAIFKPGGVPIKTVPDAPSSLAVTAPSAGGVELSWTHSASFSPITHRIEIWRSTTNKRAVTTKVDAVSSNPSATTTTVKVLSTTDIAQGQLVFFRGAPEDLRVTNVDTGTKIITLNKGVEIPLNAENDASLTERTDITFFLAEKLPIGDIGGATKYVDPVIISGVSETRYYWVRYAVQTQENIAGAITTKQKFSVFEPNTNTSTVNISGSPAITPRVVTLSAGGNGQTGTVITYDVNSANPAPAAVTLTATTANTQGNVAYAWSESSNGTTFTTLSGSGTTNSLIAHDGTSLVRTFASFPVTVKVVITDTFQGSQYTAEDTITIVALKPSAEGAAGSAGRNAAVNLAGEYATFENSPVFTNSAYTSYSTAAGTFLSGGRSLKIVANGDDKYSYLGVDSNDYNIKIAPGKVWIFSAWVYLEASGSPDTTNSTQLYVRAQKPNGDNFHQAGGTPGIPTGVWTRVETEIDLSGTVTRHYYDASASQNVTASIDQTDIEKVLLRVDNDAWTNNGNVTMYFDRLQFEEKDSVGSAKDFTPVNTGGFQVLSSLASFGFSCSSTGAISDVTPYSLSFIVKNNGVPYTYAASGGTPNTYKFGTFIESQTSGVDDLNLVNTNGTITINTTGSPFLAGLTIMDAHFDVPIIDNNTGLTVALMRSSLTKSGPGGEGTPSKTVAIRASKQLIEYSAAGSHASSQTITLTAETQGFSDPYFKFTGGGGAFSDENSFTDPNSATDTATFNIPTSYSATPYTFTVEVQEGNSGGAVATDTLTIASIKPGGDGDAGDDAITVLLSNENHGLPASNSGSVSSFVGSGTTIRVFEGVTELDYDGSGGTAGHFTVAKTHTNMNTPSISDSGNTAVVADFTAMTADSGSATYTITGKRLDGTALPSIEKIQTFTKQKAGADSTAVGVRGSGVFTFEVATHNFQIAFSTKHGGGALYEATVASEFAASNFDTITNTNDDAYRSGQNIAALVIQQSSDGYLRKNDKITVTNNASNVAVTRIYEGNPVNTHTGVSPGNFSTPVVETFDGSVIVDGTLSAGKLLADSVATNDFKIANTLTVGNTGSTGRIASFGKFSSNTVQSAVPGFFLGTTVAANGTPTPTFEIGGGGSGTTTFNNDGIKVVDSSGNTRVKLGNLSNL